MDDLKLDAVILLTPDFFFFFTNYILDVATFERPVALVMPRDGEPFAFCNELSTNGLRFARERGTLWVDGITCWSEHPRVVDRTWLRFQWPEMVASGLQQHGLARARIGTDTNSQVLAQAREHLQDLTLVPIEESLRELRWIKTEEELNLIRQASLLTDWAQERYRENVRAGRFVQELDLFTASQMAEEACRRFPGENVRVQVRSDRGPDSAAPHGSGAPTGTRIEEGDGIVNIILAQVNGLNTENERTWFCSQPNDRQIDAFETAGRAQEAAISKFVAGNQVCAVDAAAQQVIEAAGYGQCVRHRTGHGIGIAGHEFPDDMAFNPRLLQAGEVYSAEPGIYIYGLGGFRHDDIVIVGDTEPEVVTHTPKDLESRIIR
jgi:Xaa-Pro aminopeptidase/Xaa-Pro dipeptidase